MTNLATGFILAAGFWFVIFAAALGNCRAKMAPVTLIVAGGLTLWAVMAGLGIQWSDYEPKTHCETPFCTVMTNDGLPKPEPKP